MLVRLQELTFASLAELDNGLMTAAFQQQLDRVVADCHDLPTDKSAREVVMKVRLVPLIDTQGLLDSADVEIVFDSHVPKRRSKPYRMGVRMGRRDGKNKPTLVFNVDVPEDVDQPSLFPSDDPSDQE